MTIDSTMECLGYLKGNNLMLTNSKRVTQFEEAWREIHCWWLQPCVATCRHS